MLSPRTPIFGCLVVPQRLCSTPGAKTAMDPYPPEQPAGGQPRPPLAPLPQSFAPLSFLILRRHPIVSTDDSPPPPRAAGKLMTADVRASISFLYCLLS